MDGIFKRRIFKFVAVALCFILIVLVGLLVAAFLGAFDRVETHYSSKEGARSLGLFERGWLPEFIPESAVDIQLRNDLDTNTSEGSFVYDAAESAMFIALLQRRDDGFLRMVVPSDGFRRQEGDYLTVPYSRQGRVWLFLLDIEVGHCCFWSAGN